MEESSAAQRFQEWVEINKELNQRFPNAESKSVVELEGEKYQIRYFRLHGMWCHEWHRIGKE